MKLNLLIVLVIFLGSIQINEGFLLGYLWRKYRGCRPRRCNNISITKENVGAAKGCLNNIANNYRHPEKVKEVVVEKVTTISEKLKVSVHTRSLFSNFQHLLKPLYYKLSSGVSLLLPTGKDLFDLFAEGIAKVIKYFIADNLPLLDLVNKIEVALSSIARNAFNAAIKIILNA
ncbi:uncharacterized protein [Diabrotica undecimpunctata]|uniref:uncharacterized protein n=1 Tax=Diabrotica undecimpunctata TaxID=50387 RepID=UPI003B642A98